MKSTVSTLKGPGDPVEKGDQRGPLIVKKEITPKGDSKTFSKKEGIQNIVDRCRFSLAPKTKAYLCSDSPTSGCAGFLCVHNIRITLSAQR